MKRFIERLIYRILFGPEPEPQRKPMKESQTGLDPWEAHKIDQDLTPKKRR